MAKATKKQASEKQGGAAFFYGPGVLNELRKQDVEKYVLRADGVVSIHDRDELLAEIEDFLCNEDDPAGCAGDFEVYELGARVPLKVSNPVPMQVDLG